MDEYNPMISVVMAVFNAQRFLSQSIESMLSQSYEDFEFIIVDDGSTDQSWEIISKYQEADARIRPIRLSNNQGVARAANAGIEIAIGKYIARMDSDDISLPDRLSKQVDFLESHPNVGILGGGMRYMDESGKLMATLPTFLGDLEIHWAFMFESPFHNPTVMFRKSLVELYKFRYDPFTLCGEDYDFWSRILPVTRGENLASVLVHYRLHSHSLTRLYANEQEELDVKISTRAVQLHLPDIAVSEQEILLLQGAIKGFQPGVKHQRAQLIPIYFKIWDAFCLKHKKADLSKLKRKVFSWAARLIMYPPFQPGSLQALWQLTKKDPLWPIFFISHIPYFLSRRRIR
jgi:glycosyltransferase involved in cell wall biosynthesis